jgi:hypothetical protein
VQQIIPEGTTSIALRTCILELLTDSFVYCSNLFEVVFDRSSDPANTLVKDSIYILAVKPHSFCLLKPFTLVRNILNLLIIKGGIGFQNLIYLITRGFRGGRTRFSSEILRFFEEKVAKNHRNRLKIAKFQKKTVLYHFYKYHFSWGHPPSLNDRNFVELIIIFFFLNSLCKKIFKTH